MNIREFRELIAEFPNQEMEVNIDIMTLIADPPPTRGDKNAPATASYGAAWACWFFRRLEFAELSPTDGLGILTVAMVLLARTHWVLDLKSLKKNLENCFKKLPSDKELGIFEFEKNKN